MIIIKREKGIRNIKIRGKNVKFKKGARFKYNKTQAKEAQDRFQRNGFLTRIIPTKIRIDNKLTHGYYLWLSEKQLRKRKKL